MNEPTVLVVDDEPEIRRVLQIGLTQRGFSVAIATSGEEAVASTRHVLPAAILMDLKMPGIGGLEACKSIRACSSVPIIMLSVIGAERDKVEALDAGADDYLTKPFSMEELVTRIRVALRHTSATLAGSAPVYRCGELCIDVGPRRVTLRGEDLHLTPTEYNVLLYLAENAGRIITHGMVLRAVWGPEYTLDHQLLRYTVAKLRKKLGDDPLRSRYLYTEPGIGYRFLLEN